MAATSCFWIKSSAEPSLKETAPLPLREGAERNRWFLKGKMESLGNRTVSVVLITLNDAKYVEACLESLLDQFVQEIIVIDGGSVDQTPQIVSSFESVRLVKNSAGMKTQTRLGLEMVKSDFVLLAEADHVYPTGFVSELLVQYGNSSYDGIGACVRSPNAERGFFGFGQRQLESLTKGAPGPASLLSAPELWPAETAKILLSETRFGERYSFDTERGEAISRLGLKVARAPVFCFDNKKVTRASFARRYRLYGLGDADFMWLNWKKWSPTRRWKSVTHVPRTFFVVVPWRALRERKSVRAAAFLFLAGLVRLTWQLLGLVKWASASGITSFTTRLNVTHRKLEKWGIRHEQ